MRTFDEATYLARPWLPCPSILDGKSGRSACGKLSDRFSASIVYRGATELYTRGEGGFILRPDAISPLCSYDKDTGLSSSQGRRCSQGANASTCIPGCGSKPFEW